MKLLSDITTSQGKSVWDTTFHGIKPMTSTPTTFSWSIWQVFLVKTVCSIHQTLKPKPGQWFHTGTNLHHQWETVIYPRTHTLIIHQPPKIAVYQNDVTSNTYKYMQLTPQLPTMAVPADITIE